MDITVHELEWFGCSGVQNGEGIGMHLASFTVTIRTPKDPYFYFLSHPLSFSHPLSHLLLVPTTFRALLTLYGSFPALPRNSPFLVVRIPGLYLVRIPALVIVT